MNMNEIAFLLEAEILSAASEELTFDTAFGSDMMSDVLAFAQGRALLLTGLMNQQVIRTAEMMDIRCVVFVRGKRPGPEILELAAQKDIAVMTTAHPMFSACGLLYGAGLGQDKEAGDF